MERALGTPAEIDAWMALVTAVHSNFPGLETPKQLEAHRQIVLKFMNRGEVICMKDGETIAGVLLFSSKHNMICCLAVAPGYCRRGAASAMLRAALERLDRHRPVTVSTFCTEDPFGRRAPRAVQALRLRRRRAHRGPGLSDPGIPAEPMIDPFKKSAKHLKWSALRTFSRFTGSPSGFIHAAPHPVPPFRF